MKASGTHTQHSSGDQEPDHIAQRPDKTKNATDLKKKVSIK